MIRVWGPYVAAFAVLYGLSHVLVAVISAW